jgi:hypothetical protein
VRARRLASRLAVAVLLALPGPLVPIARRRTARTARAVETARIGEDERNAFSFGEIKGLEFTVVHLRWTLGNTLGLCRG